MGLVFSIAMMEATVRDSTDETNFVLNNWFSSLLLSQRVFWNECGRDNLMVPAVPLPATLRWLSPLQVMLVTARIIIVFQSEYIIPPGTSLIKRLGWPFFFISMISKKRQRVARQFHPDYSILV